MTIKDIEDQHAFELHAPWYNDHIKEAKREKRRCERKYKRSISECDRHNYIVKYMTIYTLLDDFKRLI